MDIGQIIPIDEFNAIMDAAAPSDLNVFATMADLTALGSTIYTGNGALSGPRTIAGGTNSLTINDLDALTFEFDDVLTILQVGGGTIASIDLNLSGFANVLQGNSLQIAKPAAINQSITFKDLGGTPFDGILRNVDLTAARTWDLPNSSGTIALDGAYLEHDGSITTTGDFTMGNGFNLVYTSGANTSNLRTELLTGNRNVDLPDSSGVIMLTTSNDHFTLTEGHDIVFGTTTGSTIGQGATEKIAFWGATAVVQPSHIADPTATVAMTQDTLTDNSGGTANTTIAAITNAANAGSADVGPTADAIADIAAQLVKIKTDIAAVKTGTDNNNSAIDNILADLATVGLQAAS